jgi:hypothetical protein
MSDLIPQTVLPPRVAIIGTGPGGLVTAKFLKQHGFEPVLFEQNDSIGGQWNACSSNSGVWPSMVTNTSRLLTCFSDLAPEPKSAIFPSNREILAYLGRYAALELDDHLVARGNQERRGSLELFAVFRAFYEHVIGFDKRLAVNPMIIHLPLPALGIDYHGLF